MDLIKIRRSIMQGSKKYGENLLPPLNASNWRFKQSNGTITTESNGLRFSTTGSTSNYIFYIMSYNRNLTYGDLFGKRIVVITEIADITGGGNSVQSFDITRLSNPNVGSERSAWRTLATRTSNGIYVEEFVVSPDAFTRYPENITDDQYVGSCFFWTANAAGSSCLLKRLEIREVL